MANKKNTENIENISEGKNVINIVDLLLGADLGKIKNPYEDVEITRLSETLGAPFTVRCNALSQDKHEELQDLSVDVVGKEVDLDINKLQILTVIEGVDIVIPGKDGAPVSGGSLFKNNDIKSKFKAATPKDLVKIMLLPGEIAKLYETISRISGFSDDAVKKVKN